VLGSTDWGNPADCGMFYLFLLFALSSGACEWMADGDDVRQIIRSMSMWSTRRISSNQFFMMRLNN
jgi:hypothetical protein